ncbi:MAG: patatin-like phospholipase family protein [Burkholderiaceae bacterium]|nr:patatin-like phospholipase family protein [Microbacteriaceae bacterium]
MRVLSIDGGGIRGILPATILVALEQQSGRRIHELFDLIVGTSTGGILAIALTCPTAAGRPATADDIRSLYVEHGESIFPLGDAPLVGLPAKGNWLLGTRTPLPADATTGEKIAHFMGNQNVRKVVAAAGGTGAQGNARYPADGLEAQLQQRFGEHLMSEAVLPIAVVSCNFDTGAPVVFWGGGISGPATGDARMKHAARATSAAPTFFPPLGYTTVQKQTIRCVDGGLVANDPAIVGYTAALGILSATGRSGERVHLVSLGTGIAATGESLERLDAEQIGGDTRSWAGVAPFLMKAFTTGSGELVREQLAMALGVFYVRIQTVLPAGISPAMDDASPAHVRQLLEVAEATVRDRHSQIAGLADVLVSA